MINHVYILFLLLLINIYSLNNLLFTNILYIIYYTKLDYLLYNIYLLINNTKEVSWFMNSHEGQPFITIDEEELDSVLAGNESKPYKKKIQQQMFRY